MRKIQIALLLALLPCLLPRLAHPIPSLKMDDFAVYYTAATLAREHQGAAIYNGADTGADPQLKLADSGSLFQQKARQLGAPAVRLYVYPAILADALIPITFLPLVTATKVWAALNYAALILTAFLLIRIVRIKLISVGSLLILIALLTSQPTVSCLVWGQITLFLLLLWTAGIYLFSRGKVIPSAFIFALATSIKLTPLIVILPFMIWKDWKWMRAYIAALIVCGLAILWINSPYALSDYFLHVMPSMSHGILSKANEAFLASFQILYVALTGGTVFQSGATIPALVVTLGKLCSLLFLLFAIVLVFRLGTSLRLSDKCAALALFAMLSAPIAPVSWLHAYAVALAAIIILWVEAFRKGISNTQLALLFVTSLCIGSYVVQYAMTYLVQRTHAEVLIALLAMLTPAVTILLSLSQLNSMKAEQTQDLAAPMPLTA